ncbi:MAG: hypothetical protein HDR54_07305 [Treponema sp.]|nr:hypothetical protein [Treponema sp.]
MARIVLDSNGNKLGSYDGTSDSGKVYDKDGNYAGQYFEHEIFNKDGNSRGYHNGDPETAVKILLER